MRNQILIIRKAHVFECKSFAARKYKLLRDINRNVVIFLIYKVFYGIIDLIGKIIYMNKEFDEFGCFRILLRIILKARLTTCSQISVLTDC